MPKGVQTTEDYDFGDSDTEDARSSRRILNTLNEDEMFNFSGAYYSDVQTRAKFAQTDLSKPKWRY